MKTKNPLFLTKEIAQRAVRTAYKVLTEEFSELRGKDAHVVVLVPTLEINEREKWPRKYSTNVTCLYQESFGDIDNWEYPYDEIARCKALQLWDGSNPGGSTKETPAHLLFPGDTPFWGGVKVEQIVTAWSGHQSYFDKMGSGITTSIMIGLAEHEKNKNAAIKTKECFL